MNLINGIPWKYVFVIYCVFIVTDVETAKLSITPSVNVQVGSTTVTLKCEAEASAGYTTLYGLEIQKNPPQAGTQVALVDVKGISDSSTKYTITSNYNVNASPTANFLQVVLNNPGCSDVAEYTCISRGVATTGGGLLYDRKNMTVQSYPETPQIFVDPDFIVSGYLVGSNVSIRCTGNVGNPQKLWSWRWKRTGSNFWQDFNSNADITDGEVTPPTSTRCSYASSSILKYTIQSEDHEMMIMCRLDNNDAYSNNYTIKLRNAPDTTDRPNEGAVSAAGLGGGEIAGIVIGILIFIIIIVVIIVIVLKKRKAGSGKEYNTREKDLERSAPISTIARENEMKANNDAGNGYNKNVEGLHYADLELTRAEYRQNHPEESPMSGRSGRSGRSGSRDDPVEYSTVRKDRGHTNLTLDEPHERHNDRIGYRNGGHHNPGMDDSRSEFDETEKRDPYLAEDGTDIRGSNAMLGSTV